ncbi:hypothetical protein F4814DRAFT_410010 [Daldinia grandis]|nr:hypothetical protein F4814DRAFT_410010 [Daldinia grandis]
MIMKLKTALSLPVQPPADLSPESGGIHGAILSAINIYHPGYPDIYNPLLRFLALDDGGVNYDLVYYACCIIAGNVGIQPPEAPQAKDHHARSHGAISESTRPEAYLATSSSPGATPVTPPSDGILREKLYFFHVSSYLDEPYPIVPVFNHWIFPHGNLPRPWASLRIHPIPSERHRIIPHTGHDATHVRDESCRISSSFCSVDQAHIIPRANDIWFRYNKMSQYSTDPTTFPEIDELSNTVLLRSDIHRMLDHKELTLFPKSNDKEYKLVTHILSPRRQSLFEQDELYHNRQCQELYGVGREFLFARFAWSLYNSQTFRTFESKIGPIRVLVHEPGALGKTSTSTTRTIQATSDIPLMSPSNTLQDTTAASGSRGTKRSRSTRNNKCRQYFSVSQERIVYLSDDDEISESDETEEFPRGRKLQRRNSLHNTLTPSLLPSFTASTTSSDDSKNITTQGKFNILPVHDNTVKLTTSFG